MSFLNDAFGIKITKYAIEKRLSILRAGDYITSRKYSRINKHGHITLYSLTKKSVSVITCLGRPVEQIRYGLPEDLMALHELAVTQTLYALALESLQGLYEVKFEDSAVLKQRRKKGSRDLIPDLYLELTFKDGHKTIMNIEIDMGTIISHKMVNRLRKPSRTDVFTLIFCTSEPRINRLREECRKTYIYHPELVYFALQKDFRERGFRGTKVVSIKGESAYLTLYEEKND
jgi:hypothetical protein